MSRLRTLLALTSLAVALPAYALPAYPVGTEFTGRLTSTIVPEDPAPAPTHLQAVLTDVKSPVRNAYLFCDVTLTGHLDHDRWLATVQDMSCQTPDLHYRKVQALVLDGLDGQAGFALERRDGQLQVPWGRPLVVRLLQRLPRGHWAAPTHRRGHPPRA